MPKNFRAAIGFENLADEDRTIVSASSSAPFLPAQNLRSVHVGRKWRSETPGSATIYLDFQGVAQIDTVALIGCPVSADATVRVRTSTNRQEMDAGVLSDVTVTGFDPQYGYVVALFDQVVARYIRIDIVDPTMRPIEAGRLFAGVSWQYETNFGYGWSIGWVDPSIKTKSYGGSTFVDRKRKYRVGEFQFQEMSEADRWGFVEQVEITAGTSQDVLFIIRPDAVDLHRRVVWGMIRETSAAVEQFFTRFGKQYQIEERL